MLFETYRASVDAFVAAHAGWVQKALARQKAAEAARAAAPTPKPADCLPLFQAVSDGVFPRFAGVLGGRKPIIKVRDMRTRWGSCSLRTRTLCFALRLWAMPAPAREYVAVHELCHLLHPDHSPAFWAEVARCLPDYKARRALLRAPLQP